MVGSITGRIFDEDALLGSLGSLQPILSRMGSGIIREVERFKNHAGEHLANNMNAISMDRISFSDRYVVVLDVPGVDQHDMNIVVQDDMLVKISYERVNKYTGCGEVTKTLFSSNNISYGKAEVFVKLPSDADPNNINVTVKNGVLEMTVPKVIINPPKNVRQVPVSWAP